MLGMQSSVIEYYFYFKMSVFFSKYLHFLLSNKDEENFREQCTGDSGRQRNALANRNTHGEKGGDMQRKGGGGGGSFDGRLMEGDGHVT